MCDEDWTNVIVCEPGEYGRDPEVDCVTSLAVSDGAQVPHLVSGVRWREGTDDDVIQLSYDGGETWGPR